MNEINIMCQCGHVMEGATYKTMTFICTCGKEFKVAAQ